MDMRITTESPRLDATPGEWYAIDLHMTTSSGFPRMDATPGKKCATDLVLMTTTNVPRTDATPGDRYVFGREVVIVQTVPRTSSNPGVIGAVKLGYRSVGVFLKLIPPRIILARLNSINWTSARRVFPPDEFSAGRELTIYGWPRWLARQCALKR